MTEAHSRSYLPFLPSLLDYCPRFYTIFGTKDDVRNPYSSPNQFSLRSQPGYLKRICESKWKSAIKVVQSKAFRWLR